MTSSEFSLNLHYYYLWSTFHFDYSLFSSASIWSKCLMQKDPLLCQNMSEFSSYAMEGGWSSIVHEINVMLQIGTKKWKISYKAQYHGLDYMKLGHFSIWNFLTLRYNIKILSVCGECLPCLISDNFLSIHLVYYHVNMFSKLFFLSK